MSSPDAATAFVRSYVQKTVGCTGQEWGVLSTSDLGLAAKLQELGMAQLQASSQEAALTAELQRQALEYGQEAARIKEVLDLFGVHCDSLSARGRLSVALAAKVASALGCSEATPSHVLAAWARLLLRQSEAAVLADKLQQAQSQLDRDMGTAEARLAELHEAADSVQAQQPSVSTSTAEQQATATQATAKDAEYARHIDKLSRKLGSVGLTPGLRHASLVAKAQSVAELQERLSGLQARLGAYHNLPASTLGASMMLKQARQRLASLQEQLEARLAHF